MFSCETVYCQMTYLFCLLFKILTVVHLLHIFLKEKQAYAYLKSTKISRGFIFRKLFYYLFIAKQTRYVIKQKSNGHKINSNFMRKEC